MNTETPTPTNNFKLEQSQLNNKIGKKFQKYIFQVEKELSVEDNKTIMDINLSGYKIYVIHNYSNHLRFIYITSKKLKVDTIIYGKSLIFYKTTTKLTSEDTIIYLSKEFSNLGENYVKLSTNPNELKTKNKFPLYTNSLFYTEVFNPDSQEYKIKKIHRKNIHDTRIVFDREMWFIEELNELNIKHSNTTILKNILNKAIIDNTLKKVLITEFFILDQFRDEEEMLSQDYMMNNSHNIILTQGGTGKSSILCMLGNDLHTTTDAGMFGYMDIQAGGWRSGEVSKTKDSIIVDEINEIIKKNGKKGESVLDILNTPLENGKYSYGKAGGMKIQFGNQFSFLGNLSDEFHFENFVNGLSGNQSTMGRRFAYIIYDDNLDFINGEHRDIIKHLNKIKPFKEFLSYVLLYFLKTKKFQDKKVRNNKYLNKIINDYKILYEKEINNIEHPNTKQFFKSFTSHSLENRIPTMALKLTIFNYIDTFRESFNNKKRFSSIDLRLFWKDFYREFIFLLEDNLNSIKNIASHQNIGIIKSDNDDRAFNQIKVLKKSQKLLLVYICGNITKFDNIRLFEKDMINRSIIKKLKNKIIKRNQTKFVDEISRFGVNYFIQTLDKKQTLNFTINNKYKFDETCKTISKHLNELIKDLLEKNELLELESYKNNNNNNNDNNDNKKDIKIKETKNINSNEINNTNEDILETLDMSDL